MSGNRNRNNSGIPPVSGVAGRSAGSLPVGLSDRDGEHSHLNGMDDEAAMQLDEEWSGDMDLESGGAGHVGGGWSGADHIPETEFPEELEFPGDLGVTEELEGLGIAGGDLEAGGSAVDRHPGAKNRLSCMTS